MYGVLGLDPISPQESEGNQRNEAKSSTNASRGGLRAYGLAHKLFMTEADGAEAKADYQARRRMVEAEIKMDRKHLEYKRALEQQDSGGKTSKQQPRFPPSPRGLEETKKAIDAIHAKANKLNIKIAEVGEKQGLWNEWLVDLKTCLKRQTRVDFYFKPTDEIGARSRTKGPKSKALGTSKERPTQTLSTANNMGSDEANPKPDYLVKIREKRL